MISPATLNAAAPPHGGGGGFHAAGFHTGGSGFHYAAPTAHASGFHYSAAAYRPPVYRANTVAGTTAFRYGTTYRPNMNVYARPTTVYNSATVARSYNGAYRYGYGYRPYAGYAGSYYRPSYAYGRYPYYRYPTTLSVNNYYRYGYGFPWYLGGLGYALGYGGYGYGGYGGYGGYYGSGLGYGGYYQPYSSGYLYTDPYDYTYGLNAPYADGYGAGTGTYVGQPAPVAPAGDEPPVPADAAVIRVTLPDPSAQVFLNGQPTTSIGSVRRYVTPHLDAGQAYTYDVRAVMSLGGQSMEINRRVTVTPGKVSDVNLTVPAAAPQAPGGFGGGTRTF
jgi:uncharacterized protein (TIGR03000 family)